MLRNAAVAVGVRNGVFAFAGTLPGRAGGTFTAPFGAARVVLAACDFLAA
jgi:hypothetical protein